MWLARHTTPASFPAIGRAFGNRDHTTVMQACRRVDALMAADREFAGVVEDLRRAAA
jgi:chromosomal replication initiator protein